MISLAARIDARLAAAAPRRPALVVDGVTIDEASHADRIARAFGRFAALGLAPGDRVAILSSDVAAVAVLMLAGIRHGLVMLNLNPEMSAHDAGIALAACRPAHLFLDTAIADRIDRPAGLAHSRIAAAAPPAGLFARLRRAAAPGFWSDLAATAPTAPPAEPPPDAAAMLLFTSGTTSAPKVVVLSHANLSAQLAAFDAVYDYDRDSRILNPLPLHFTDGMLHGPIAAFVNGAALYRPSRFDFRAIEALVHSIYRDRITHFIVVPALLSMLDRLGDAFADAFEGEDFRYIRSSGDLLAESLWRAIESRFKVRVVNTYGMSETVCEASYAGPDPATARIGTIGRAIGCEMIVADADGTPQPPCVAGELLVRGPIVMAGYLDQPELTAAAVRDGWMHTGDLATIDAEGFIRITGRRKALIISGGVNIQPQDINDWLSTHKAVAEAFAFGLPHALWGEQVAAAVVLRDGGSASEAELIAHCAAGLSPQKVPRVLAIVAELPRSAAGKVQVDRLRAALAGLDRSAGSAVETDVFTAVARLAAAEFGVAVETLRLTAEPATTPGWNSLAHLNLVSAVEAAFGIELSATEVLRLHSLADVVAAVQRLQAR